MAALAIPPDLSTDEKALGALKDSLKAVIEEDLDRPIEAQRLTQISLAERNYLYMEGKQYLVPHPTGDGTVSWRSITSPTKDKKNPRFASVYNNIYSDGAKYVAVVGQRPPNMKAVAIDPGSNVNRQQAETGDLAIRFLHAQWNIKRLVKQCAFHQWVTGPCFGRVRWNADGYLHGWSEEPNISVQEVVGPDGSTMTLPMENGVTRFAKGMAELDVISVLYVTVPFGLKSASEIDWLSYRRMMQRYEVADEFGGKYASEGNAANILDAATMQAQADTETPGGQTQWDYSKRIVRDDRYLTPRVYAAFPAATAKALARYYPDGLVVTRIGDDLLRIKAKKLLDEWTVCKTGTGEYINSFPIAHHLIDPQNDRNSFYNMGKEIMLRSIPRSFVDHDLIDPDQWRDRPAMVGEMILARPGTGENLSSKIGTLPTARFSDQLLPFGESMRGEMREIDGVQPVLFGGGPSFDTWRQSAQARNMALMQIDPQDEAIKFFVQDSTTNGVKLLAKYGVGSAVIPPAKKTSFSIAQELQFQDLSEDGWRIEPVDSVPMTYAEQVQRVGELSSENPQLASAIGLGHPVNAKETQQMFGIPGFYAPGENEEEAALELIDRLLQEAPVEDLDPMTGRPVLRASIRPKSFEHKNHALFAEIFRTWCNSQVGRREEQINQTGYQNVQLHGQEQDELAAAAMAPPPDAGGGKPPAPKGKKGNPPPGPTTPVEAGPGAPIPPVAGDQ